LSKRTRRWGLFHDIIRKLRRGEGDRDAETRGWREGKKPRSEEIGSRAGAGGPGERFTESGRSQATKKRRKNKNETEVPCQAKGACKKTTSAKPRGKEGWGVKRPIEKKKPPQSSSDKEKRGGAAATKNGGKWDIPQNFKNQKRKGWETPPGEAGGRKNQVRKKGAICGNAIERSAHLSPSEKRLEKTGQNSRQSAGKEKTKHVNRKVGNAGGQARREGVGKKEIRKKNKANGEHPVGVS